MSKIYVASAHGGNPENIRKHEGLCRMLTGQGHFAISPHCALSYLDESTQRDIALAHGKELMHFADQVIFFGRKVNGEIEMTSGMLEEKKYAEEIGMPYYYEELPS